MKICMVLMAFFSIQITFAHELGQDVSRWSQDQFEIAKTRLMQNVSPKGAIPGSVVASPSKDSPNYYYNWVRDAGLVMLTINRLRTFSTSQEEQDFYLRQLFDYVDVTRIHQSMRTAAGLGEVKFYVNGAPFTGPWGRPQNDGPAIRALTLTKLANYLMEHEGEAYVRSMLYDSKQPTESVIKKDLEYVSHNWKNHDFDLWEEIMGHHFFTRLLQRRALLEGAKLAKRLGDMGAGEWYASQAQALEVALNLHWDENAGFFRATQNRVAGIDYKQGMDSSVIIAIINSADAQDTAFSIKDDRFMSSLYKMKNTFSGIYSINSRFPDMGTAIGRYPEDRYDGYSTGKLGNPWFITTAAFASYYYKLAKALKKDGSIKVTKRNREFLNQALTLTMTGHFLQVNQVLGSNDSIFSLLLEGLIKSGDSYVERIRFHAHSDGSLSEQMNRETGYMQGAEHLTWSYSSFINVYLNRQEALR